MRKWGNAVCSERLGDDEERGRSNPEEQVQSWMASCLAMTKCVPRYGKLATGVANVKMTVGKLALVGASFKMAVGKLAPVSATFKTGIKHAIVHKTRGLFRKMSKRGNKGMSKRCNGAMKNNQQLLIFSLKGFIIITVGEHSVTCGESRHGEELGNPEHP